MSRFPSKFDALTVLRRKGLPVGSVIDVGVQTSTPELMNIYPDVKHFLFEPLEEYHDAIEENYKRIPHVLFGLAASNVDGHGELGFMSQSGSGIPTHSHVVGDDRAANWRKRQIKTVTLDSAMASQPAEKPYLLKIDVDGHE